MSLVIVAIPKEDDYVWKLSSEKVPHLTLLYLGDNVSPTQAALITTFLEHATSRSLNRFGLDVDRRGTLGADEADVVFFSKYGQDQVSQFRSHLLKNDAIKAAYDSAEQFDGWTPHLTLGYPDTPAHPDNREYPGLSWITFDRVALWFGDYEGPEFPLKTRDYEDYDMAVAMSSAPAESKNLVAGMLKHYGVKGMKWGVRKDRSPVAVSVSTKKGGKPKASGGSNQPATKEALGARATGQIIKKSGAHALTNEQLAAYTQRMNLERNATNLAPATASTQAKRFIAGLLSNTGKQQATRIANDYASQQVAQKMKK